MRQHRAQAAVGDAASTVLISVVAVASSATPSASCGLS